MYSMAAFGPVLGFLLGGYLLSFHMDSFSKIVSIGKKCNLQPPDTSQYWCCRSRRSQMGWFVVGWIFSWWTLAAISGNSFLCLSKRIDT